MKTLEIRRHSDKTGEHINQSGIERLALVFKNPEIITDLFCGSDIGRTAETALAAVVYGGVKPERLYPATSGLGNLSHFNRLLEAGFMAARTETGDNLLAAQKCLGDQYGPFCQELLITARELLDQIPEGSHGLAFGHSPLIEMAAEACGQTASTEVGACQGFVFTLHTGHIEVKLIE